MLTHSFEDLAQTFRVMVESYFKLNQLITVDRPEAVGTIETAINAKLNAFHSLYDLMQHELRNSVDWYAVPELCILLAIRNARHHNKANRIRSICNYHNQVCESPTDTRNYFYVDFPAPPEENGGDCFDIHLSWTDIDTFLSLSKKESRLKPQARWLIRDYVNADQFEAEAFSQGFTKGDIFINFVPLALNAGIVLYPYIKDHVKTDSIESKYFLHHFKTTGAALTQQHEYKAIRFSLPE